MSFTLATPHATQEEARGCRVVPLFGVLVPRALAELALAEALGVLVLLPRLWRARRLRRPAERARPPQRKLPQPVHLTDCPLHAPPFAIRLSSG